MLKRFVLWYLKKTPLQEVLSWDLSLPLVVVDLRTHSIHKLHSEIRKGKIPGTKKPVFIREGRFI